jgi:hypothetical protein
MAAMKKWWATEYGALKVTIVGGVIVGCILLIPNFFSSVLAAVVVEGIKPYLPVPSKSEEGKGAKTEAPSRKEHSEPTPDPLLTTEFRPFLGERRDGEKIANLLPLLGPAKEFGLRDGGVEICFLNRGLHFLFDRENLLDKVIFYADQEVGHFHTAYNGKLPLDLRFGSSREDTQKQIDAREHTHVEPELRTGEYDKIEVEGCRLYLRYVDFDGDQRIQEVQLVRPEDPLEHEVAWTR